MMNKTLSTEGVETNDDVELDCDDKVSRPATKKYKADSYDDLSIYCKMTKQVRQNKK